MDTTVVIGGGVIGLLAAREIRERGGSVVVLDRAGAGAGCSSGNLGWVVPSMSEPLAAPGLGWSALRWMILGDGPLVLPPLRAPRLAPWLWRFWRRCNRRDYERGVAALAGLGGSTLALYDDLASDGVPFEMHRSRILLVALAGGELDAVETDACRLARFGLAPLRRLTAMEARGLEPALTSRIAGGLLYPEERHVRPEALCAGLKDRLAARGVAIREGVEVVSARARGRLVESIGTSAGRVRADRYLIAAGAWSGRVARAFGFRLPMRAGKGYSITLRQPGRDVVRNPLYLQEAHVGLSPYKDAVRVGGILELCGLDGRLDRRRLAAVRRAAKTYLPDLLEGREQEEWAGLRPVLPDGLPAIGRAPGLENVYVAAGHAMLGVTLAPATGRAIARLIAGETSESDLEPFDPGRFQARTRRTIARTT